MFVNIVALIDLEDLGKCLDFLQNYLLRKYCVILIRLFFSFQTPRELYTFWKNIVQN